MWLFVGEDLVHKCGCVIKAEAQKLSKRRVPHFDSVQYENYKIQKSLIDQGVFIMVLYEFMSSNLNLYKRGP